jgi:hypothetical protein
LCREKRKRKTEILKFSKRKKPKEKTHIFFEKKITLWRKIENLLKFFKIN